MHAQKAPTFAVLHEILGKDLGVGGYVHALRRTYIGQYGVDDAPDCSNYGRGRARVGAIMIVAKFGTDEILFDPQTAITVGTFDGVHVGHQQILERMNEVALKKNLRTVVVTFHPHPQIVLAKPDRKPVKLLTTIEERCAALEQAGIHTVVILPFSTEFCSYARQRIY